MQALTPQGQQAIDTVAQRHGFSTDAVLSMLQSVINGNGTMAQFSHPEFGGSGQWMQGGMTMVGDMFNSALKARVDGLCADLASLLVSQPLFAPAAPASGGSATSVFVSSAAAGNWWPAELGTASSTGSQNGVRYAVFPATRRLAIEIQGNVTVYDTLDHQIGGVSQQQGGASTLSFTSQYGLVRVFDLPIVSGRDAPAAPASSMDNPANAPNHPGADEIDVLSRIEKLADLHRQGILNDAEFAANKAELLKRL